MIVLDASALLALLFDEDGAAAVEDALVDGAAMGVVNLAEVLTRLVDFGVSPEEAWERVSALPILFIEADQRLSLEVARLRAGSRSAGLSLGDRACLALGRVRGEPVLTGDRRWAALDLDVEVRLIR